MQLLIVNDQFESGGAARVACVLCNELINRGYEIWLATDTVNSKINYPLNKEIHILDVDFHSKSRKITSRLASLYRTAKEIRERVKEVRPKAIIAVQANAFLRTLIANIGLHYPIIAADHTSFLRKMDFINTITRHYLYKYSSGLSILTNRDARVLGSKYPQKRVIYNPLSWPITGGNDKRRKTILAVGRFDIWQIKGFDILFTVWGKLEGKFHDWMLEIAGSGSNDSIKYIKKLIYDNHLDQRVKLLGYVSDMQNLYQQSGIYVLSSRIEGMPMSLLEAMSQGCPCVAFDVGGASSEMMGKNGGVVVKDGDCDSLESYLSLLMNNSQLREKYSNNAIEEAKKFSVDTFIDKWEELINHCIKK